MNTKQVDQETTKSLILLKSTEDMKPKRKNGNWIATT
jgi:hypothetical protein